MSRPSPTPTRSPSATASAGRHAAVAHVVTDVGGDAAERARTEVEDARCAVHEHDPEGDERGERSGRGPEQHEAQRRLAPQRRCEHHDALNPRSRRSGRGRREADGQALDAADQRDAHRLERHGLTDDFDVGQAREELPERDRDLAASEVRAEAEVRSRPTEADVRVGIAQHVEAFGIVEHARVTVGDAVEQHDLVAFRELVVADARRPSSRCAA